MTRKIIFCLFFLGLTGILSAQEGIYDTGDFVFERNGSSAATAVITGYRGREARISIPDALGEFPVTVIGDEAFRGKGLTGISGFPERLTEIGINAFADNRLTRVSIPGNVEYIGAGAFSNNRLTSVTFGNGVIGIEEGAFLGNRLEEITFPDSIQFVYENAFAGNPINKITIGSGVDFDLTAFDNRFGVYYTANGRKAGTFVFNEGQWLTEQEWALKESERCCSAEDEKLQEGRRRERERRETSRRDPVLQLGLEFEDIFSVESEMMSNMLTLRPWVILRIGDNASLRLAVNFSFPWDKYNEWQDMIIEPDENILLIESGNDWLKLGRINYSDPLNVIAGGLFDGIELSLSSLQLGVFYTGLLNKGTANIAISRDDLFDYADDNIRFAPQRIIGSAQYKLLDSSDSYFLLGGLAQYDLRETSLPVNTYYALSQIHIDGYSLSIDGGAAVSFLKTGDAPYKMGIAASADIYRRFGGFRWLVGLQWFSGTINDNITPFVPVTGNLFSPNSSWIFANDSKSNDVSYPSLWIPRLSFRYSIDNSVSLDINSRWLIREGFESFSEISDYSQWKVDIGLTVSTAPVPSSSSRSSSRRSSGIDLHIPVSMGVYFQSLRPSGFSSGSAGQLGIEIDLGSFMAIALLGEAGMGFGVVPLTIEGFAGAMGEVYFANKRLGFGMGLGYCGNLTTEDIDSISYINYALIFRRDSIKTTLYAKKFNHDTWGIGVLFSITGDLL